jgi:hypothetical protein
MNKLEIEFMNEIKRLGLRRLDVTDHLGITYPTLRSKLQDPGRFTYAELDKLKELKLNLNNLEL